MKKIVLFLSLYFAIFSTLLAQNIPADCLVNWSKTGAMIPEWSHEIDVLEHGLTNDGVTDNAAIFEDLMSQFDQ